MELIDVDGMKFPKMFETNRPMKEHMDCVKALDMKDDDVIVCAFPKSGTHWLWEVASMLLSGKAELEKRTKEYVMMEATQIEKLQAEPSPRVLNTHVPVRFLPRQLREKKVKIIHIYRNPKDVVVSMYHHVSQYTPVKDITLAHVIYDFVKSEGRKSFVNFLKEMDTFMKDEPDHPVFNVSFEDIKEDPLKMVTSLAEFLGVKASPELCADIVKATEFSKMKEADASRKMPDHLPKTQMYRKGEVGDWKNHLTVAQSESIDAMVKELAGCNYHFRYTL